MLEVPFVIEDPNTGQQVELTSENTAIFIFPGEDLDHVLVKSDDEHGIVCYNTELLAHVFASRQFPVTFFPFVPAWAVERRMMQETPDFERLLDE